MKSVDLMSLWNAVYSVLLCYLWEKNIGDSQWGVLSLTERTEFTEVFSAHFEPTEGLRHTEFTEAFQLRLAVTFCEIGWLNVSVKPCVFCSSVLSVRKRILENCRGEFLLSQRVFLFLTELTDLTELFCVLFRTHRTPPAYRYHRALLLMKIPIRR